MKTLLTTTAIILAMSTAAMAGSTKHVTHDGTNYGTGNNGKFVALPSPTNGQDGTNGTNGTDGTDGVNGTDGKDGSDGQDGTTGPKGDKGDRGDDGQDGTNGTNGTDGTDGANGSDGVDGLDGSTGSTGPRGLDGADGKDAVAPLGSLSFAAASATLYGDGIGFGLSNSNYGSLEGSIVVGFDLDNDWRVVGGITTDFNGKTAGSIGVGVSF